MYYRFKLFVVDVSPSPNSNINNCRNKKNLLKMWILKAIVIHLLLLGSIFVIYFRSPVITGLRPGKSLNQSHLEAPAKRLVLIVTDGLRAESFFQRNCDDIPHVRSLFMQQGVVGLSHTRVPTESRPGHIALIAGLYEDPSAVMSGWKENPIDFDTIFNRSSYTYAWGANDVLHIFSRISDDSSRHLFTYTYDHQLDFSGRDKTYALDEWVFERVPLLLKRKSVELQQQQGVVFFLHLLGLDSAGHIHKPGTKLFLENLHRTDRGILEMYDLFERTFPDRRTAYVLTSDHGMTNAGSHGSGDPLETETPFFLWGAGVTNKALNNGEKFQAGANIQLPLHTMEQAQMAPFMSALIGVAPPMNNFGILPVEFLNVSSEYQAQAAHSNALQLLEQFKALLHEHQREFFAAYLPQFLKLNMERISSYMRTIDAHIEMRDYAAATQESFAIMYAALEGIDYYHGYYRYVLLLSTTATFLAWIVYLLQLMVGIKQKRMRSTEWHVSIPLCVFGVLLMVFLVLQRVPFITGFYLTLPILVWLLLVIPIGGLSTLLQQKYMPIVKLIVLILCAELLVFAFFERKLISLAFLLFSILNNLNTFAMVKGRKFYIWLLLVLMLPIFPLMPQSIGYTNTPLLLLGMLLTIARPFFVKAHNLNLKAIIISSIAMLNAMLCIYQHTHQIGVTLISQAISWSFLVYVIATILFNSPTLLLKERLEQVFFNLSTLYILLCTSYESLFLLMLASELMLSLSAQQSLMPSQLDTKASTSGAAAAVNLMHNVQLSFRLAFAILLYTFFSFFGTGNIASLSSFDPNIIRCFLTTFSPFIIMGLVILKLIIPVMLNLSLIFGLSEFARTNERQIFICLLLICDIMGLNFLFLVRNRGSWLEIGTSISHFVIMEVTTLVLVVLTCLAKLFLKLNTQNAITFKVR